jgi:prepilin peptidase CpaA
LAIQELLLILLLAGASWTDIREQKIYNKLTFPMTLVGMVLGAFLKEPPYFGLAGAAIGLFCSLPLEFLGVVRMGDVKLLMAVGALVGPEVAWRAVLLSVAVNMIYGVAVLAYKGRLKRLIAFYKEPEKHEPTIVAYGPAIAVASLIARFVPLF